MLRSRHRWGILIYGSILLWRMTTYGDALHALARLNLFALDGIHPLLLYSLSFWIDCMQYNIKN